MADQDHLLRTTNSTTTLGNNISLKMVDFLDHVKDQPLGFRDLGLEFLSICKILNALQTSLQERFKTNQLFAQRAISELIKILDQTLADFTQLQYLLQKFMQYEQGGSFATLQKTWRLFFADKDISRVRTSLQRNKGALTMTMLLTNIDPGQSTISVAYEYGMLAAKLETPSSDNISPRPTQPHLPYPQTPTTTSSQPDYTIRGSSASSGHQSYNHAYLPSGWQENRGTEYQASMYSPPSFQAPQPSIQLPADNVPQPPSESPPPKAATPPPIIETRTQNESLSPSEPPPYSSDDILTRGMSQLDISSQPTAEVLDTTKSLRITVNPSQMPRRVATQTSVNPALQRTLVASVTAKKHSIVEQLLRRGVSPNTGPEKLALSEAVLQNDLIALKLLLEYGADPNLKASDGSSPLRYACQYGREDEAKLLLEYGADPNIMAPDRSPLNWCLDHRDKSNSETMTRVILQYGADANLIMDNGWTNLVWACSDWSICGPAHVHELITYGADVNLKQTYGEHTPLNMACKLNKHELVEVLLKNGADPNLPGPQAPVDVSISHPVCMQYLVDAGADVRTNTRLMEVAVYQNQIDTVKLLLNAGCTPNVRNSGGYTPLNTSIRDSHFDILALLLSKGADPNFDGGEGFPIQLAANKPEAIKQLITAGVNLIKPKLLELAVYRKSTESIHLILDAGYPIGGLPDDYYLPLTTAVRDDNPEYVSLLLSRGADPNLGGGDGMPLALAINKPVILRQLLSGGADTKRCNGLLESAVYRNCTESIHILLAAGVPINGGSDDYYRPLHTAIRDNHPELVALLLSKGADPNYQGGEGLPLQIAITKPVDIIKQLLTAGADAKKAKGVVESAVYRGCNDAIPVLVRAGANVNGDPDDFYRPLHTAIRDNLPDTMSLLISLGVDLNLPGGEGMPLLNAACYPDSTRLRILLDAGVDINIIYKGWTALMWACEKNMLDNAKLLLQRGADPHIVGEDGQSAMDIAGARGHDDLVMLLLDAMD